MENAKTKTEKPVHSVRYPELDLAKAVGIGGMVLIHVLLMFYPYDAPDANVFFTRTVAFLGRFPAAPVFMFCLGAGVCLSRRNAPGLLLRRGIRTLAAGYVVVNFLSYVGPQLLAALLRNEISVDKLVQDIPYLLYVDILQFAGLTFLFFATVKYFALSDLAISVFAAVASLGGMLLSRLAPMQAAIPGAFLGLLWGTGDISCFPFLSWIIFPCGGYLFCKRLLIPSRDKNKLYAFVGIAGTVAYGVLSVAAIGLGICFSNFGTLDEAGNTFYHMNLYGGVAVLAFMMGWLGLCHWAVKVLPGWAQGLCCRLSRHITVIYVLHYFILNCIDVFMPAGTTLRAWEVLALTAGILAVSEVLAGLYEKAKGKGTAAG